MSSDPAQHPGDSPAGAGDASQGPSEAELRAAYEAELSRITPGDVMMQAAVSLLNLGARRLGLTGQPKAGSEPADSGPAEPERDLGQVRDAIDGVRAMLAILERSAPGELGPLRDALSQLPADADPQIIQDVVYEVGRREPFLDEKKKAKDGKPGVSLDWFNMLYQVLLGQEKGPRFGSFVAAYGIQNTIDMIDGALARSA